MHEDTVYELDIFIQQLERLDENDENSVRLALATAKRVRRLVTISIRALAEQRDNLQA